MEIQKKRCDYLVSLINSYNNNNNNNNNDTNDNNAGENGNGFENEMECENSNEILSQDGSKASNNSNENASSENTDDSESSKRNGRPLAVDRESAAVAQICIKLNVPFAILKFIAPPRMDAPNVEQEVMTGGAMIQTNSFLSVVKCLFKDYIAPK